MTAKDGAPKFSEESETYFIMCDGNGFFITNSRFVEEIDSAKLNKFLIHNNKIILLDFSKKSNRFMNLHELLGFYNSAFYNYTEKLVHGEFFLSHKFNSGSYKVSAHNMS